MRAFGEATDPEVSFHERPSWKWLCKYMLLLTVLLNKSSSSFLLQSSWVDKIKECLENRIKMSRRKMKRIGEAESPNPKRQRSSLHKDHLLQRLDNTIPTFITDNQCCIFL